MPDDKSLIPITSIGEIRGFFDIFLPGLFVFLHVGLLVYVVDKSAARGFLVTDALHSPAALLLICIPSAYVIGLALRMVRTVTADRISARFVLWSKTGKYFHNVGERTREQVLNEQFPYRDLMKKRAKECLPPSARVFYDEFWAPEKIAKVSVFTFEFWKTLLASVDPEAGRQAYFAETFVRLAAHTCYALMTCVALLLVALLINLTSKGDRWPLILLLFLMEAVLLLIIVYNFRFLRAGEVEHVFASCFNHREALLERLNGAEGKEDTPSESGAAAAGS